jgi:DNA-directed RNA polymerase specialized sigma24 family protein
MEKRDAIIFLDSLGQTSAEIALALGMSATGVRTALHRARKDVSSEPRPSGAPEI